MKARIPCTILGHASEGTRFTSSSWSSWSPLAAKLRKSKMHHAQRAAMSSPPRPRRRIPRPFILLAMASLLASASWPLAVQKSAATLQLEFGVKVAMKGSWNEAAFRFQKAVDADENNARAHNNLGVARENLGQFEAARAAYEKALQLEPSDPRIRLNHERLLSFLKSQRRVAGAP